VPGRIVKFKCWHCGNTVTVRRVQTASNTGSSPEFESSAGEAENPELLRRGDLGLLHGGSSSSAASSSSSAAAPVTLLPPADSSAGGAEGRRSGAEGRRNSTSGPNLGNTIQRPSTGNSTEPIRSITLEDERYIYVLEQKVNELELREQFLVNETKNFERLANTAKEEKNKSVEKLKIAKDRIAELEKEIQKKDKVILRLRNSLDDQPA